MRREERIAATAIFMYIVFFAMSPPPIIHRILHNVVGMIVTFGIASYITLYKSEPVGALLLISLLLSMSRSSREGLENQTCSSDPIKTRTLFNGTDLETISGLARAGSGYGPRLCGERCCANSACTGYTYNNRSALCHLKSGTITEASGSSDFSGSRVTRRTCSSGLVKTSTRFYGEDLRTIDTVGNVTDCGTACCADSSCNAYTYNSSRWRCELKSGTITESSGGSEFSGSRVIRTANTPGTPPVVTPPVVTPPVVTALTNVSGSTMNVSGAPTMSCGFEGFTQGIGVSPWTPGHIKNVGTVDVSTPAHSKKKPAEKIAPGNSSASFSPIPPRRIENFAPF
jgi:hypothetical protein